MDIPMPQAFLICQLEQPDKTGKIIERALKRFRPVRLQPGVWALRGGRDYAAVIAALDFAWTGTDRERSLIIGPESGPGCGFLMFGWRDRAEHEALRLALTGEDASK